MSGGKLLGREKGRGGRLWYVSPDPFHDASHMLLSGSFRGTREREGWLMLIGLHGGEWAGFDCLVVRKRTKGGTL